MKKLLTLIVMFLGLTSIAQDSTSKVHFKLGINYNSYLHYYGRSAANSSSGVFPMAELWLGENFYLNAAPVWVNNVSSQMDYAGTVASAGYQFVNTSWYVNAFVTKPFYKAGTPLVQSALKAQTGLTVSRITPVISLTLGGDVKFSGETDFGATAGLDHAFQIPAGSTTLVIDPSVMGYAGTQRFSNNYIRNKTGFLGLPAGDETFSRQSTQFNILAYECSVPVIALSGPWTFMISPAYILPQNLITVPNRPDLSEYGKNQFYFTAGVKYTW